MSELYNIKDYSSYSGERHKFKPDCTPEFCINFARKGYFTYDCFRRSFEEYSSRILVEKPGSEYVLTQQLPGEGGCTILSFSAIAYEEIKEKYKLKNSSFFSNENIFSVMLAATPELDYLHYSILKMVSMPLYSRLKLDILIMEIVDAVMKILTGNSLYAELSQSSKRHHLNTIERAKEYMLENFTTDISLNDLAKHCYISPFHFSRIFKQFCAFSPLNFIQHLRLKHAETMLRTTNLSITDICFESGFNRLDYFSTVFTKKYTLSPSKYKLGLS
ncbi:MAG: AraC family transcriptional regulator [Parafilimonas sp.]